MIAQVRYAVDLRVPSLSTIGHFRIEVDTVNQSCRLEIC